MIDAYIIYGYAVSHDRDEPKLLSVNDTSKFDRHATGRASPFIDGTIDRNLNVIAELEKGVHYSVSQES